METGVPRTRPDVSDPDGGSPRVRLAFGLLLVALGLVCNTWAIERAFASDHRIEPWTVRTAIVVFQVVAIGLGLAIVLAGRRKRFGQLANGMTLWLAAGAVLAGGWVNLRAVEVAREEALERSQWQEMEASEEVIMHIATLTPTLAASVLNLEFPDEDARRLFAEDVRVQDVGAEGSAPVDERLASLGVSRHVWTIEAERRATAAGLRLWQELLADVKYFSQAKFSTLHGAFLDDTRQDYEAVLAFSGLAHMERGGVLSLHGKQRVRWRAGESPAEGETASWLITGWQQLEMHAERRETLMFDEVLDEVLADGAAVARARHSRLAERWGTLVGIEGDPFDQPELLFEVFGGTSPGVSVVDLDQDGLDDIFLVDEEDNLFLRARGDGSYEDLTEELGLHYPESASATFADFDNDGDADLFLGRNYAASVFLENQDGAFVDRSHDLIDGHLPYLVSASAAADHDNDGLLDLYVSTYGFSPLGYERRFPQLRSGQYLLQKYLREDDAAQLDRFISDPGNNWVIQASGPPNVLFHNEGDGLLSEDLRPDSRVFRNSFHSTWSDVDEDGDMDLYVANDFAPNNLLRNDGGGRFVDIAEASGTTDVGFGMGVSFGDYDRDGDQDLYVTNMYSKAGKRVLSQFTGVDERLKLMYRGNSLYRNESHNGESNGEQGFDKVSGTADPALLVEKAGWSWGGQFVDVDNDGFLDLYALSGMITAPARYEIPVDI
jgi:hypothetical protein